MDGKGVASTIVRPFSDHEEALIQTHLVELLDSKPFAGSRRSKEFLRYVVSETLAGAGPHIKERNIAVDVFSKGDDFDPQNESIVRVGAAEVRKRLALAYENGLGKRVRIDLPVGSYHPTFHFFDEVAPARTAVLPKRIPAATWAVVAIFSLALVAATLWWFRAQSSAERPSQLDLLWRPFQNQSLPVLMALPAPTVFQLKHHDRWFPLRPNTSIPSSELIAKQNYFVGVGAAFGAARFSEQLALRHQPFFIKFGEDANFSDLSRFPAILLGAFSSPLTMEMTKDLRFHFYSDEQTLSILDSQNPRRTWVIHKLPVAEASEGYALVCRLLQSDSGHPLLIVGGLSARDTQAAVAFLDNNTYFDAFAKTAPSDWPRKNLEVVLHSVVHGDAPSLPQVVASYVW